MAADLVLVRIVGILCEANGNKKATPPRNQLIKKGQTGTKPGKREMRQN